MRRWGFPWRPREYAAIVAALHETEAELANLDRQRRIEASHLRETQAQVRHVLEERRKERP